MLAVACLSIYLEYNTSIQGLKLIIFGYLDYTDVVDVNVIFPPVIVIAY